jgi:hypothetical protein
MFKARRFSIEVFAVAVAFAGGYYTFPKFPPPARDTSIKLISVNRIPSVLVMANDRGEQMMVGVKECREDAACVAAAIAIPKERQEFGNVRASCEKEGVL